MYTGKTLYVVVPCYNEEDVLPETAKQLLAKVENLSGSGKISPDSRIVFVDDGSDDRTWELISMLHSENKFFRGIKLSRNRGHQNALLAGLFTVSSECDAVISLDADLQDDVNAIDEIIDKFNEGCDVVYGVRDSRETDTFFKKFTAEGFYKIIKCMGADIVFNHADYRLMSRRAIEGLLEFKEVNMFLRGIVPMIGYPCDKVYYKRRERFAGKSKYPFKKMWKLATDGIVSFSTKPLKIVGGIGILTIILSICILIYSLISFALKLNNLTPGWTSIMVAITLFSGVQLLSIYIISGYISRIYDETRKRPEYIIDQKINLD
jgi:glycosyltransferase involved in cell wall biosynthesis